MISEWMDNGNLSAFVRLHPDTNRIRLVSNLRRVMLELITRNIVYGRVYGSVLSACQWNGKRNKMFN
jgi:hypothetical protein